jgi:hypothetical protein
MRALTEKVLKLYQGYYDINVEHPTAPFAAEATFHIDGANYFLMKTAVIARQESYEYVFIAEEENLTEDRLKELDEIAWKEGVSRIHPHSEHRNSDVTLVIISDHVDNAVQNCVKKLRHYKSYKLGLWGWTNYRVIMLDEAERQLTYNRQGESLKTLFQQII